MVLVKEVGRLHDIAVATKSSMSATPLPPVSPPLPPPSPASTVRRRTGSCPGTRVFAVGSCHRLLTKLWNGHNGARTDTRAQSKDFEPLQSSRKLKKKLYPKRNRLNIVLGNGSLYSVEPLNTRENRREIRRCIAEAIRPNQKTSKHTEFLIRRAVDLRPTKTRLSQPAKAKHRSIAESTERSRACAPGWKALAECLPTQGRVLRYLEGGLRSGLPPKTLNIYWAISGLFYKVNCLIITL